MPADTDDYARRPISLQKHASQLPSLSLQCPGGCLPVSDKHQQENISKKYSSEKNLISTSENELSRFINDNHEHNRFSSNEREVDGYAAVSSSERFGSERSLSDRLPSGERYQMVSERYPLGERPSTSISTDMLIFKGCQNDKTVVYQPEKYSYERTSCPRYTERCPNSHNVGSLDRYHANNTMDRYSRTSTPTERYHTLSTDKERNNDRYTPIEKYQSGTLENYGNTTNDRLGCAQSICTAEHYTPTERHRNVSKTEHHKSKERSCSSDRKEKERQQRELFQNRFEQYAHENFSQDRFPAIPCPERFATQGRPERPEKIPLSQIQYLEPPSPAPASDRFIPPPPLSPEITSSPDCFTTNAFPSPTTTVSFQERFIPPPPLSPSPTTTYAHSPKKLEKYDKLQKYHQNENRCKDRYELLERYTHNTNSYQSKYVNTDGRFSNSSDRYVPPNAHIPVERYVPQPQEPYYGSYQTFGYKQYPSTDSYNRRELAVHYRFPLPYTNQIQRIRYTQTGTPSRIKCCPYQEIYQLNKSSPGSSSSSSMTSQGKELIQKEQCINGLQEIQCQNYKAKDYHCPYQQEKAVQCGNAQCQQTKDCVGFPSPNLKTSRTVCRHSMCISPSIEYVGASGGRHVCATPPPRGSIGSGDGSTCSDNCCSRRTSNTVTVTVCYDKSMALEKSEVDKAVAILEMDIKVCEEYQSYVVMPYMYDILAAIFMATGNLGKAEELLVEIIEKMIQLDVPENDTQIVDFKLRLARIYSANNDDTLAEIGFKNCLNDQETKIHNGDTSSKTGLLYVNILFWYGLHKIKQDDFLTAKSLIYNAYSYSQKIKGLSPYQEMIILTTLSDLNAQLAEYELALQNMFSAILLGKSIGSLDLPKCYLKLGKIYKQMGSDESAGKWLKEAYDLALLFGDAVVVEDAEQMLGKLKIQKMK